MTQKSASKDADMTAAFSAFLPFGAQTPDLDALADRQRQMLQTMMEMNRAALEGYQTVMVRQAELLSESVEDMTQSVQDMMAQPEPGAVATRQVALMRRSLEQAYSNVRELTELATEANATALKIFQDHMADSGETAPAPKGKAAAKTSR